jgi:hypothetical protein
MREGMSYAPEESMLDPETMLKLKMLEQHPEGMLESQQVLPPGIFVPEGQFGARFSQWKWTVCSRSERWCSWKNPSKCPISCAASFTPQTPGAEGQLCWRLTFLGAFA